MNILHNFLIPEAEHRTAFWAKQPIDDPQTINGFNGTFAFSEHSRIPQSFQAKEHSKSKHSSSLT